MQNIAMNLVRRQFGRHGNGWIGLCRTSSGYSQTGRVFTVRRRQQITVVTRQGGSASQLTCGLAVASCAIRPVLGLHELVVVRPMASWWELVDALPTLRHPERIHHIVRRNAVYHLYDACQHSTHSTTFSGPASPRKVIMFSVILSVDFSTFLVLSMLVFYR